MTHAQLELRIHHVVEMVAHVSHSHRLKLYLTALFVSVDHCIMALNVKTMVSVWESSRGDGARSLQANPSAG